jgi:PQQ-dependent dehydrogenase (methanol/ethanol family)
MARKECSLPNLKKIYVAVALSSACLSPAMAQSCCAPTAADSPKVGGNYGNQNYSSLAQITPRNIRRLGAAWETHLEGGSTTDFQQSTVVAVAGVLYIETSQGRVHAVDGKTGSILWTYDSGLGTQMHRGVAIGEGKVFATMADRTIVALDQATGRILWKKQFDEPAMGSLKTAVIYYDGLIYFGSADSQRGVATAMRAADGEIAWQFHSIPAPGEPGSETWGNTDAWKTGGGAPWMHPAIDPELHLVYWTFGNSRGGAPVDGSTRPGQNLFTDSLVAFDLKTGKRAWYFQSVHHDIWDFDGVMAPVLIDINVKGKPRKGIVYGSKTAMWYILDRADGTPLTPILEKPVPQEPSQHTWATQPFPVGDSLAPLCPGKGDASEPVPAYKTGCIFTPHTDEPVLESPGISGGTDWNAVSFHAGTRLLYTGAGIANTVHDTVDGGVGFRPLGERRSGKLMAFDPVRHRIVWQHTLKYSPTNGGGVLTTASGVGFIGQPDGLLTAFDIKDGHQIWSFQTGAGVHTTPITYSVNGEQYIAIFAGGNGIIYNSPKGDNLWAWKLGGTVPAASTPEPPSERQPIVATAVEGSTVKNTILLARSYSRGAIGAKESTLQNSMAPQKLRVATGTAVTFKNPTDNQSPHCAVQFFEGLFKSGPLQPGQSFTYTFTRPGEYFYNDCTSPRTTGEVIVY